MKYTWAHTVSLFHGQHYISSLLQGYAIITIDMNDRWNGIVAFYSNSTVVYANEDEGKPAVLTVQRRNAYFGDVTVRAIMFCF